MTPDAITEAIAAVPLGMLLQAGLLDSGKRTRVHEEFRVIATRVLREMRGVRPGQSPLLASVAANVLMVTSARPNEGKSFTALNLAAMLARHGTTPVLLVDTDTKRQSLSALLGLSERFGLADLAANPALPTERAIVATGLHNLSVLPVGTLGDKNIAPTRPAAAVIETLGRRFPGSLVILDTPPCLSTSDPNTMAPLVGHILMVVEAERTQRADLEASLELVRACPSVMLMLNKTRINNAHSFGAYDYG